MNKPKISLVAAGHDPSNFPHQPVIEGADYYLLRASGMTAKEAALLLGIAPEIISDLTPGHKLSAVDFVNLITSLGNNGMQIDPKVMTIISLVPQIMPLTEGKFNFFKALQLAGVLAAALGAN